MGMTKEDVNWADKYRDSDHHKDRLVRTKVEYENTTGVDYPEPRPNHHSSNMAWGKGGSTNVVHVTTKTRRAFSVPADDVVIHPHGLRTAQAVSYANEDALSSATASRRQDQRLLKDITQRLANAPFTHAAKREREPRSRRRRAPSVPISSRRGSVSSSYSTSKPRSLADEDFEIVFPKELKAVPPCVRRAHNRAYSPPRSASLPPSPPSRESKKSRGYGLIETGSPLFRLVDAAPNIKPSYSSNYAKSKVFDELPAKKAEPLAKRRYSFAFEEPSDFVKHCHYVPQTNAAHAYQFATPTPYVRRYTPLPYPRYNYSGYESDYQPSPVILPRRFRGASEPRGKNLTPVASLAVKQARASLNRIERELGMGAVTVGDDAPYVDEPIVTTTNIVPVRSIRTGFHRTGGAAAPSPHRRASYSHGGSSYSPVPSHSHAPSYSHGAGYSHGALTSRPPLPKSTKQYEIEARLETFVPPVGTAPPVSYSTLRSRTADAKNKMDVHRNLLDRYLPVPVGPPNDVEYEVQYKFNELADRMPHLRPRENRESTRAASLPPYRPANAPANRGSNVNEYRDAQMRRPYIPRVSDTRKRARDVLCRTKGDPHYFDY